MKQGLIICLLAALLAAPVQAQDFEWQGWGGPVGSYPVWGGSWATAGNTYTNGWGATWLWSDDPTLYYPDMAADVLFPAPHVVEISGGVPAVCSNLTLANGAELDFVHGSLAHYGLSFVNEGQVTMSNSILELHGVLDISGAGSITWAASYLRGWDENVVVIGADQTLTGQGYIGWQPYGNYEGVRLRNHGEIVATDPNTATDIFGLDCVNDGLIRAEGRGIRLWGDWDNTGGVIEADGSLIEVADMNEHSAHIGGGTLRTLNDGQFTLNGSASLEDLLVDGVVHIPRYYTGHLRGELTVTGSLLLGVYGWSGNGLALLDTTLTLGGSGETRVGTGSGIIAENWPTHNPLLVVEAGHTIRADGGQFGEAPGYYGDRRIVVDNRGDIVVDPVSYHGYFWLAGEGLTNSGRFEVAAAANRVEFHGAYAQSAGRTVVDGLVNLYEGPAAIQGGVLEGRGTLSGGAVVGRAEIHPGRDGEGGTLTVGGDLSLSQSTLVWEWDPVRGNDLLVVTGTLSTADTVTVRVASDYVEPAKAFDAVCAQYAALNDAATWVLELPDGWSATLVVEPTRLRLTGITGYTTGIEAPPTPGPATLRAEPNPFNPLTTLRFRLTEAGPVRLEIFDLTGRRVRRLLDGPQSDGEHAVAWTGRDDAGRALASGAYLAVLETAAGRITTRLALVR
jgi:hypothetical protein